MSQPQTELLDGFVMLGAVTIEGMGRQGKANLPDRSRYRRYGPPDEERHPGA